MRITETPVVLLDCDGVLADFTGAYLDLVHELSGLRYTHDHVTGWHIPKCEFFAEATAAYAERRAKNGEGQTGLTLKGFIDRHITLSEGFARDLKPLPGAREAVKKLQEAARVYVVTSPWHSSKHWAHERVTWLQEHMGIRREHVIQASDKSVVWGDILVDDKPANLHAWPHGRPILWDAPWNRDPEHDGFHRARSWDDVFKDVARRLERR